MDRGLLLWGDREIDPRLPGNDAPRWPTTRDLRGVGVGVPGLMGGQRPLAGWGRMGHGVRRTRLMWGAELNISL